MRLTVDGKTYEFEQDQMLNTECMAIEKVTAMTTAEWEAALKAGSMQALTALVWVIQKRDEPSLRFSDVVFAVASLSVETEDDEGKDAPPALEAAS